MTGSDLDTQLAALEVASLDVLRQRWLAVFGSPAPVTLRRGMLARAVAYRLQAQQFGDVTIGAVHRGVRSPKSSGTAGQGKGEGVKLIRSWKGQLHTVEAVNGAFVYAGETYRSLSAVARKITGTQWNGLAFFGVKGRVDLCRGRAA